MKREEREKRGVQGLGSQMLAFLLLCCLIFHVHARSLLWAFCLALWGS